MHFDIVHAADPRFLGGTSSALRAELKAAKRFGLKAALLPFVGRSEALIRRFDPRTARLIDQLGVPWLTGEEPATCDILFAHHPQVFERMPAASIRIRPSHVVCVAHHPPFDGLWTSQYDVGVVQRNLERMFGTCISFAPVGPKVRSQFDLMIGDKPALLRRDLHNMIDMSEWHIRGKPPPRQKGILGRHARPFLPKWPESESRLLAAYPDAKHLTIQVLGGVPEEVRPWLRSNWKLLPFSETDIPQFLSRLDFYVYFHSRQWVEAFGVGIVEAMASGLVVILEQSFQNLFGDGAVYSGIQDTAETIDRFIASPRSFAQQSARARKHAEKHFSLDTYPARMREVCDDLGLAVPDAIKTSTKRAFRPWRISKAAADAAFPATRRMGGKRRVLFVATNGIGLGHITRLLAIAERMSSDVEPVFFTRSAGSALIRDRGHPVDYIPWAVKMGVTDESWNVAYAQELLAAIECFDVAAVVFDGTYPFAGLIDVAAIRPDLAWVWIRRALWVPGQMLDPSMQDRFGMVVEPGELAGDEDKGPTTGMPGPITKVGPILLSDPCSGLPRAEAAARLGVDPEKFIVAMQLGSQRNFDYYDLPRLLAQDLIRRGVQVVQVVNPLAGAVEDVVPGVIRRDLYPLSDCLNGIDLLIANAGYNTFHECVFGGVPSVFVPNEAPEMDDQSLRAAYAHTTGLGLRLRASEVGRVRQTLDLALSDDFRREMRRRSARLPFANGALEAARTIEQLLFSVRANKPLYASLARA